MNLIVDKASKWTIYVQNHQYTSVCTPEYILSASPLLASLTIDIDLQTPEAVCVGFCIMLLYQTDNINCSLKYTYFKLNISTI